MPAEPTQARRPARAILVAFGALLAALVAASPAGAEPAFFDGISADGEIVLFTTRDHLVPGDTDNRRDVYQRSFDGEFGEYVTRQVSVGPTGGNDAFDAFFESVSTDGSRVVFSTDERLVAADTDLAADVYVRDAAGSAPELASTGAGACLPGCGNDQSAAGFAGASGDGDMVLVRTDERLDPAADTDGSFDVYVRDLDADETFLVSAGIASCLPGCGNATPGADLRGISADGSSAYFVTAERLDPAADTDSSSDLYARTLPNGPTALLSRGDAACLPGCGNGAGQPIVFAGGSGNGAAVFFETSEGLTPADTDGGNDVYRHEAGTTTLVSGAEAQAANFRATSHDGDRVFFVTDGALAGGDVNGANDVYLWQGGAPSLVSSGECCGSTFGAVDGAGTRVAFSTTEELVAADTDGAADVYSQEIGGGAPELVSRGEAGCAPVCGNGGAAAKFNGASTDGELVFFTTDESLVSADADLDDDIYRHDLLAGTTTLFSPPPGLCPLAACDAVFSSASSSGDRAFFLTEERLDADDIDSEIDVYERAAGGSGVTRLVSVGNPADLGPEPPSLDGTDPPSPGASITPALLGEAEAETSIKIYSSPDCSGQPVAVGTAGQLESTGIPVTVAAGSETTFRATAEAEGFVSPCSLDAVAYKQQGSEPPPGGGSGSDGPGGSGAGGGDSTDEPPAGSGDKTHSGGIAFVVPRTRITFAPAGKTRVRRPVFRFTDVSGQPGTRFRCRIDRARWSRCGSPTKLKRLALGRHLFQVKAVNAVGEWELRPVRRAFKLVGGPG